MKTNALCPVSNKQVNEKVARFSALLTVFLLVIFALSNSIFIPVFLAVDFLIRTTNNSRYSPIANLSVAIVKYTKIENSYVNAGPKLFATRVGLIFSSLNEKVARFSALLTVFWKI